MGAGDKLIKERKQSNELLPHGSAPENEPLLGGKKAKSSGKHVPTLSMDQRGKLVHANDDLENGNRMLASTGSLCRLEETQFSDDERVEDEAEVTFASSYDEEDDAGSDSDDGRVSVNTRMTV